MADVLSSGPEPGGPSHPRRRWTTPLAGALVAAAAVYLAVHAGGGMAEDPRAAGPTPSAPAPTGATPTGPAPTPATYRLHGDPGLGPTGVRILVGGRRPAVLDAGTGRLAPLPIRLGPVDVAELDHAGGTTTVVLHNPYRLRSRAVAVGRSGKTVALGQALDALPLRDGSVLTQDCSDPGGTGPCTLTGYAATGAVLWRRPEPRPLDLVRDTPYGLLVRTYDTPRGGVVQLEDPRSGATYRVIGRAAGILGADDRQVVFAPASCATECDLVLADLDTGSSRFLPENPGSPTVAAFSRDGRRVAIGYAGMLPDDRSADPQRDGHVVVIDQHRSDFWQSVPEVTTGPASTALPVWSPDGRLLLAVPTDGSGSGRVVAWQPGAPRVTVLPVGLTGFYGIPGLAAPLS